MALQFGKTDRSATNTPVTGDAWHRMSNFLKAHLEADHKPQSDAELILSGLRRQPDTVQQKILSQFERGNSEPLLGVTKIYYNELQKALTSAIDRRLAAQAEQSAAQIAGILGQTTDTPATTAPSPKNTKTEIAAAQAGNLTLASGQVEIHRVLNARGDLSRERHDLQLDAEGRVQGATNGTRFTCLFLNNGKLLDRTGQEVSQLQWGSNVHPAGELQQYLEPLKAGVLSGVKNGYLKDIRLNGEQVVFTTGSPPVLSGANLGVAASPASKPAPQVTLPQPTPSPVQTAASAVEFHVPDHRGQHRSVSRILRLQENGELQMKFRGEKGETVWSSAADPSTRLSCDCLFVNAGKLYDRSGMEVTQLQWGNSVVQARNVLAHLIPPQRGQLSGLKDGYLNDVRHNGKNIVFTAGLPSAVSEPGTSESGSASVSTARNETRTNLSLSLPHGVNNYRAIPLECALDKLGQLLVRRDQSHTWQKPDEVEFPLQDGRKRGLAPLYYDKGRLYRENGEEVRELTLAGRKMPAELFEFGVFRYLDRNSTHSIFGMQSQYVNDVALGDKQVIFIKGLPPKFR